MRIVIKPAGLLAILLVIFSLAGLAVYWQMEAQRQLSDPYASAEPRKTSPTPSRTIAAVLLVVSKSKADWVRQNIERFNAGRQGKVQVEIKVQSPEETTKQILDGSLRATLWVPDNAIWADRLQGAWVEKNPGKQLFDPNNPLEYRTYLRTPMVFLTTKTKAGFLRPLLSGQQPWKQIRALSNGTTPVPWGQFRFTFADPSRNDSGFLTLAMMVSDFAEAHASGNITEALKSPDFDPFLADLAKGCFKEETLQKDAGAAVWAMAKDMDKSPFDVVCTYESEALKAVESYPDLVMIYPTPTLLSETSAVQLTNAPWVETVQKTTAADVLNILGDTVAIAGGIEGRFRPQRETSEQSLSAVLNQTQAQGGRSTFVVQKNPPFEAVQQTLAKWQAL